MNDVHGAKGAFVKKKKKKEKNQPVETPKKVRENSRECHNHKPLPFPDTKRKRKQTKPNKRKSNKRTKTTKICSLLPKRGNRNAKWTVKPQEHTNHRKQPRYTSHHFIYLPFHIKQITLSVFHSKLLYLFIISSGMGNQRCLIDQYADHPHSLIWVFAKHK